MDKIKVCYIVGALNQGGAERQLVELIKNIDKEKFDISLVFYLTDFYFYSDLKDVPDLRFMFYNNPYKNKIVRILSSGWYIYKILKQGCFDVVHTMLYYNGMMVRLFAPHRYNNRIIASMRNNFDFYPKYQIRGEKFFLRKSWVVTNTERSTLQFRSQVKGVVKNKIQTIYNGYDKGLFFQKQALPKSHPYRFIMVGRYAKQKNYLQMFRVMEKFGAADVIVDTFGDIGDLYQEMVDFIDSRNLTNVKMHSPMDKIYRQYPKYDAVVICSNYEGCPNVLFEAMFSRLPAIISEAANTDNFVKHGDNGLVYDNTDEGLYRCLLEAMSLKEEEYYSITENAYRYAEENFSMESMVRKYEDLYIKLKE